MILVKALLIIELMRRSHLVEYMNDIEELPLRNATANPVSGRHIHQR